MSDMNNINCNIHNTGNEQSQFEPNPNFISFNNSPGPIFTPVHYSSPLKADNYRRKNWNNSRNYKVYNRSPNNSSGNYYGTFNNSTSYNARNSWSQGSSSSQEKMDITRYLHPSFMEDPWKKLEEEFVRKKKLNT